MDILIFLTGFTLPNTSTDAYTSLSFFCFPTTHSVALNGQSSGWRLSVLMESTTEITHRQKNAMQRLNQHIFGCNLKWYTWILRLTNVGCKNVSYHSREGQLNWKKKYKSAIATAGTQKEKCGVLKKIYTLLPSAASVRCCSCPLLSLSPRTEWSHACWSISFQSAVRDDSQLPLSALPLQLSLEHQAGEKAGAVGVGRPLTVCISAGSEGTGWDSNHVWAGWMYPSWLIINFGTTSLSDLTCDYCKWLS